MAFSKVKMALESAKSLAKNIAEGNDILVSEEEKVRRLGICKGCPDLQDLVGAMQCGKCGCFLNIKAGLNSMSCPKGEW